FSPLLVRVHGCCTGGWTSGHGPARLHRVPIDRSAAVGVRSITSDQLQTPHHRERDRHRYKPRRAVHRPSYATSSDRKSWVAFVGRTVIVFHMEYAGP